MDSGPQLSKDESQKLGRQIIVLMSEEVFPSA